MIKNLLQKISVAVLLFVVVVGCLKGKSAAGETLDENVITLIVGETATLPATMHLNDSTNKTLSWTSSNPAVVTVENGIITAKTEGTVSITVTTETNNYKEKYTVTVVSKGVRVNGIIWATCNVDKPGTFATNPEDLGMYYQWNRKRGWSDTGDVVDWDGSIPLGDTLEKANDPCPAGWRLPTKEELESLLNTDSRWEQLNGVNGRFFGNSEVQMFLPAAGRRHFQAGAINYVDSSGFYWSGTALSNEKAYAIRFKSELLEAYLNNNHGCAFSVRCVAE